jgi:DNA-binding MarR family transcriptional regulator
MSVHNGPQAFDTLASARLHVLARLSDRVHGRHFRRLSNLGVPETHVLAVFGSNEALSFQDVCDMLRMDPAHTSRLIQKLVSRGLLEKVPDPQDQRRIRIALTLQGRATHEAIHAAAAGLNEAWLATLSAPDRAQFVAALDRLTAGLQQLDKSSSRRRQPPLSDRQRPAPGRVASVSHRKPASR